MLNLFHLPVLHRAIFASQGAGRAPAAAREPVPDVGVEPGSEAVQEKPPCLDADRPGVKTGPVLPAFAADAPPLPKPGSVRDPLTLPDEILAAYAEEYQHYAAPWKHLVGVEIPNFFQFVVWHERILPASRVAAMESERH